MFVVPFAFALGPSAGPDGDGVIYGHLPRVAAVTALRISHLASLSRVLRGNADAAGAVTFTDITIAANNDSPNDVALFDTANPTADRLCIELAGTDRINSIKLLLSTAAILTGTPVAQVRFKTSAGWQMATGIVTPPLTAAGLVSVGFDEVNAASIVLTDDLIDPVANPQMRCMFLQFGGITGVTTPPTFTRAWKGLATAPPGVNVTALLGQGDNPDFSGQVAGMPVAKDLTLFGFDEKPLRLVTARYLAANVGHITEWVYSTASGGLTAIPAASITDPTNRLTAALATASYTARTLVSTLATGSWGSSGTFSTVGLTANGHVEGKAASPTTSGGFLGLSISNDAGESYTGIDYAWHVGHGGAALCSVWSNGVQQSGTFALSVGDVMRVERVGTEMRFHQNGTLRHTITGAPAGTYKIDTAFINLGSLAEIKLIDASKGYDLPVAYDWTSASAVIQSTVTLQLPTTTTSAIALSGQTDWAKSSFTDSLGVAHNRYWIGLRTTADVASPTLPDNFTLRGQPIKGTGVVGIPAPETTTYTSAMVVARGLSPSASRLMVINSTSGASAEVVVPANTAVAQSTISMSVVKGDAVVMVHVIGDPGTNLSDGAIYLS